MKKVTAEKTLHTLSNAYALEKIRRGDKPIKKGEAYKRKLIEGEDD